MLLLAHLASYLMIFTERIGPAMRCGSIIVKRAEFRARQVSKEKYCKMDV
jgi:hypothetical protein